MSKTFLVSLWGGTNHTNTVGVMIRNMGIYQALEAWNS